jgi:hypothetical protein
MTFEFDYQDPINPGRKIPRNNDGPNRGIGGLYIPFIPTHVEGYKKNSSWQQKSPYGGHLMATSDDSDANIDGAWLEDDKYDSTAPPNNKIRPEYSWFCSYANGTGVKPGSDAVSKMSEAYPVFWVDDYFNKGSKSKGRGFAWRVISDNNGMNYGTTADVAGLHMKVWPVKSAYYTKSSGLGDRGEISGSAKDKYQTDWQINQVYGVWRDRAGNYFSIIMLPRGDNYDNNRDMDDPDKGQYVFRNSVDSMESDTVNCTILEDSHWANGGYLDSKGIELDLLIPSDESVPYEANFVGFEISIWLGTKADASKKRIFCINEVSVIPEAVAKLIRGKNPNQYTNSLWQIIPETMSKDDFDGRRQRIKKYVEGDKGRRKLY